MDEKSPLFFKHENEKCQNRRGRGASQERSCGKFDSPIVICFLRPEFANCRFWFKSHNLVDLDAYYVAGVRPPRPLLATCPGRNFTLKKERNLLLELLRDGQLIQVFLASRFRVGFPRFSDEGNPLSELKNWPGCLKVVNFVTFVGRSCGSGYWGH